MGCVDVDGERVPPAQSCVYQQTLTTIRGVTVSGTTNLCSSGAGTTTTITFTQVGGNVPLLQITPVTVDATAVMSISQTVAGTTEDVPCSNRGLCDPGTGACTCFTGYGSSNGAGGSGFYPDCGYAVGITDCPTCMCGGAHVWRRNQAPPLAASHLLCCDCPCCAQCHVVGTVCALDPRRTRARASRTTPDRTAHFVR